METDSSAIVSVMTAQEKLCSTGQMHCFFSAVNLHLETKATCELPVCKGRVLIVHLK